MWPDIGPHLDNRVLAGAAVVGLPIEPDALARLADDNATLVRLAAALVRVSLNKNLVNDRWPC